jgi:uncharacterized membrane protein YraQ (UPF0718 family)
MVRHLQDKVCAMVQLSDVLKAIGPNASIVFASWIFMGFLQQRYDGALSRYGQAVGDYRSNKHDPTRSDNLKSQVLAYRHRCRLMSRATLFGLLAAILLIGSLIVSGLDVIVPKSRVITMCGIGMTMGGLVLVIVAALIVIVEARVVKRQIDDELRDVAELAEEAGGVAIH